MRFGVRKSTIAVPFNEAGNALKNLPPLIVAASACCSPSLEAFRCRLARRAFRPAGYPVFRRHLAGQRQQRETSGGSLVLAFATVGGKYRQCLEAFQPFAKVAPVTGQLFEERPPGVPE